MKMLKNFTKGLKMSEQNILDKACFELFQLPLKKNKNAKYYAFFYGDALHELITALSNELSYTDALRVASAILNHVQKVNLK